MKLIHSKELRLALGQLSFILMLSLPLLTFPSGSIFARFIPDVIAFTCLGLWGLLTLIQKETRHQTLEVNSLGILALVWTAIVAAQYFSGLISTSASFTLMSLGYFLAMLMIGVLVNMWIKAGYKTELFQSFLTAVLVAAVLNAIVIVIQSSIYIDLFIPMIEKGNPGRPGGFISQSNIAGSCLLCGLIALVFLTKDSEQTTSTPRVVNISIMVLLMYAINQTASRIVVLEMVAVMVILFAVRKQFSVSRVWLLIPVWQTVIFLISYLAHQVADISHSAGTLVRMAEGQQARYDIYQGVINIIKDHPIWGIGWRQLQLEQMSRPELDGVPDHAHNLLLQVQLELGVLGSVSLLVFLIYWLKQRHIWTSKDPVIAVGLLVCVVFGLHSMAEYPLWFGHSLFVFCVGVAFLAEKPLL
jgi:O-antigen ligase